MTVQAFILMTEEQASTAEALDDINAALGAQEIVNTLANNLGLGTLVGMWVSPARLLNDPAYERWYSTLGTYPIHVFDSEILFNPDE